MNHSQISWCWYILPTKLQQSPSFVAKYTSITEKSWPKCWYPKCPKTCQNHNHMFKMYQTQDDFKMISILKAQLLESVSKILDDSASEWFWSVCESPPKAIPVLRKSKSCLTWPSSLLPWLRSEDPHVVPTFFAALLHSGQQVPSRHWLRVDAGLSNGHTTFLRLPLRPSVLSKGKTRGWLRPSLDIWVLKHMVNP